jgi:hypothetical protein
VPSGFRSGILRAQTTTTPMNLLQIGTRIINLDQITKVILTPANDHLIVHFGTVTAELRGDEASRLWDHLKAAATPLAEKK